MTRPLASFTVEELDALPVGSRFVCLVSHPDDGHRFSFTKSDDGRWRFPDYGTRSGFSSAGLIAHWCIKGDDDYHLDGPGLVLAEDVADLHAQIATLVDRVAELEAGLQRIAARDPGGPLNIGASDAVYGMQEERRICAMLATGALTGVSS